jgi:hypothetical protein
VFKKGAFVNAVSFSLAAMAFSRVECGRLSRYLGRFESVPLSLSNTALHKAARPGDIFFRGVVEV